MTVIRSHHVCAPRSHYVCARERFDLDTYYVVRLRRMQVFSLYNHLKINKLRHKTVKIMRGCIETKNQKPFEQHTQKAFLRKNMMRLASSSQRHD
jgi:hypothetical protein